MAKNNLSLNDQVQKAKLQIQAAVKASFNMGALKQNMAAGQAQSVRDRISVLERQFNTKKIDQNTFLKLKIEEINKLFELKAELTKEEQDFITTQHTGQTGFVAANTQNMTGGTVMQVAEKQLIENKIKQ